MSAARFIRLSTLCLAAVVGLSALSGCNRDPSVRKQKYLQSGQRFAAAGKYREASIQFSNALKIDRNYAAAHFELAKAYAKLGSAQAAYGEYLRAVDLDPTNVQARVELGELELLGGLPDKAQEQAQAVLASHPDNAESYSLLSGIATRKSDLATARDQMNKAISLDPKNPRYHTAMGLMYAVDPATAGQAETELGKALSLDPKSVPAHLAMAELEMRASNTASAEQQFQAAVNSDPSSAQAHAAQAAFYMHQHEFPKAEQTLKDLMHRAPNSQTAADMLLEFYARTNQMPVAENTFGTWATENPKNFVANYVYARVLLLERKDDKADTVLPVLTKLNPRAPETALVKNALLLDRGKVKEAQDALKEAIHEAPDNVVLQMTLGRLSLATGDLDTAMTSFQEAARINPKNLDALAGEAEIGERRNDTSLLLQLADKALSVNPGYEPALIWRAASEATARKYEEATKDFENAEQMNPRDPRPLIELGRISAVNGKLSEASAQYEKALAVDPNSEVALHGVLTILMANKQPDKALARVKQQIAAVPNNPVFYRELGSLEWFLKDYNGSRDAAQKALNLNPGDMQAAQVLSRAYVALGQIDVAISVWQDWSAKHPRDSISTSLLGELYEAKGDIPSAETWYQKSLQLDPQQAWAANNLAYQMVEHNGNLDQALALAQRARAQKADDSNIADTLGWIYYHKGMYPYARDLLEAASKTDAENPSIQLHLGLTYLKLGDRSNATTHLRRAASSGAKTPVGQQASEALSTLG